MKIPGLAQVTAESPDDAIIAAIDLAGAYLTIARPYHRRNDFPETLSLRSYSFYEIIHEDEARSRPNPWAWVKPDDIGPSSRRNPALLERLKNLSERGLLEIRYDGNLPRFRVKRFHLKEKEDVS